MVLLIFQDVIDGTLHEIGLGGAAAVHKYWRNNIQDYALRLQREDNQLVQQYQQLSVSYLRLCITLTKRR